MHWRDVNPCYGRALNCTHCAICHAEASQTLDRPQHNTADTHPATRQHRQDVGPRNIALGNVSPGEQVGWAEGAEVPAPLDQELPQLIRPVAVCRRIHRGRDIHLQPCTRAYPFATWLEADHSIHVELVSHRNSSAPTRRRDSAYIDGRGAQYSPHAALTPLLPPEVNASLSLAMVGRQWTRVSLHNNLFNTVLSVQRIRSAHS